MCKFVFQNGTWSTAWSAHVCVHSVLSNSTVPTTRVWTPLPFDDTAMYGIRHQAVWHGYMLRWQWVSGLWNHFCGCKKIIFLIKKTYGRPTKHCSKIPSATGKLKCKFIGHLQGELCWLRVYVRDTGCSVFPGWSLSGGHSRWSQIQGAKSFLERWIQHC